MTFVKGQSGNPNGPKPGYKQKKTLDREQRRIVFEELVSDMFPNLVRKSKPEYLLDQFIGKAKEQLEVGVKFIDDEGDTI